MNLIAWSLVGIGCWSTAFAQVTGETCTKLADTIAAGYSMSFSDHQFDAARYYARCEADQSSSNKGLSIAYSAFSLGAQLNDSERKSYCSKSFDSYNIKAVDYNSTKIVFNQALATIDKCIDAASKGWAIRYEQLSKDSVSLNISNASGTGGRLLGIDVIPAGALICSPALPSDAVVVSTTSPFATTCTRTPATRDVNGISITYAADAVLNLRLSDGPFPIKLAGYSSSIMDDINRRIDMVRSDLTQLITSSVANLHSDLGRWPPNETKGVGRCPDGQYAVGLNVATESGLAHGAIYAASIDCRPLGTVNSK